MLEAQHIGGLAEGNATEGAKSESLNVARQCADYALMRHRGIRLDFMGESSLTPSSRLGVGSIAPLYKPKEPGDLLRILPRGRSPLFRVSGFGHGCQFRGWKGNAHYRPCQHLDCSWRGAIRSCTETA
jgi:hypothetical protein